MTRSQIMEIIDEATEPKAMNKEEALDFLEDIISQIEMRIEALREEMEEK